MKHSHKDQVWYSKYEFDVLPSMHEIHISFSMKIIRSLWNIHNVVNKWGPSHSANWIRKKIYEFNNDSTITKVKWQNDFLSFHWMCTIKYHDKVNLFNAMLHFLSCQVSTISIIKRFVAIYWRHRIVQICRYTM